MACTGPTLLLRFARGAKILGTRSPSRLNFVRRSINTGGSSVWKLHHVTVLVPIIYETVSRFVTNCGPLPLTVIGHLPRYAAARVGDLLLLQSRGRRGAAPDSCQMRSELQERWLMPFTEVTNASGKLKLRTKICMEIGWEQPQGTQLEVYLSLTSGMCSCELDRTAWKKGTVVVFCEHGLLSQEGTPLPAEGKLHYEWLTHTSSVDASVALRHAC